MFKSYPALIAELSANHNGSLKNALKLIKTAKINGADAVKIQTFDESSMTLNSRKKNFVIKAGIWKGWSLWDLYKKAKTPLSWHGEIFSYAKKKKIICFSSAFSPKAVWFLEKLNCPIYKVASFEITDLPLISEIAKTGKPIIISTGLANIREVTNAYEVAKKNGAKKITLLYCVSSYPAHVKDFNLNNIKVLKNKFNCEVGFSDHSKDSRIAMLAIALGARIIEKHIALENQKIGLDINFSLRGNEIGNFKKDLVLAKRLVGTENFIRKKNELKNLIFRRSYYALKDIKKNSKISNQDIISLRPKIGASPDKFNLVINYRAKKDIKKNTPIFLKDLKK